MERRIQERRILFGISLGYLGVREIVGPVSISATHQCPILINYRQRVSRETIFSNKFHPLKDFHLDFKVPFLLHFPTCDICWSPIHVVANYFNDGFYREAGIYVILHVNMVNTGSTMLYGVFLHVRVSYPGFTTPKIHQLFNCNFLSLASLRFAHSLSTPTSFLTDVLRHCFLQKEINFNFSRLSSAVDKMTY